MKNSITQFVKIIAVLFVTSFAISCTSQQKDKNNDHNNRMNHDETEMIDSDDHMNEDGLSDEHMINDTTPMQMNEKME